MLVKQLAEGTTERRLSLELLQNLQSEALFQLHPGCAQQRTDGLRRAALPADHFTEIVGGNAEFENGNLLTFNSANLNFVGVVDESFSDICNQFLHERLHSG
jgi:hypothetical protein